MAASQSLLDYLKNLGLSDAQIQSLLTSMGGTDGQVNENDVATAAARYAAALASGALTTSTSAGGAATGTGAAGSTSTTAGAAGAATAGAATPASSPDIGAAIGALGLPASPLAANPAAANQQITAYQQQQAADLLAGKYTPYQMAAGGRGQNPNNLPGPQDASPEANLPGMAYVGKVDASILTPEQAAAIRYNTPEFQAYLAQQAQQRPESIGLTTNNLANAYAANAYAGNAQDLSGAIVSSQQADYAAWLARFGLTPEQAVSRPGMSYADYTRGMAPRTVGNTIPGQLPSLLPEQTVGPMYGGGPVTANQPGQMGFTAPPGTPLGTAPAPGGGGAYPVNPQGQYSATGSVGANLTPPPAKPVTSPGVLNQADIAALQGYIANLTKSGTDPAKLAEYKTRLTSYQQRLGA